MPAAFDTPTRTDDPAHSSALRQGAAAVAVLSLGAGFLHAAVVKAHEGHGVASNVFTVLAVVQVAWAGLVLARPSRPVLLAGAAVNLGVLAGYVVSRTSGISFIDGFQDKEPVGFTDGVTTGIEVALVVGALVLAAVGATRRLWPQGHLGTATLSAVALVVGLVGVPAVTAGAEHAHDEGADHAEVAGASHAEVAGASHDHSGTQASTDAQAHPAGAEHASVEPVAYDPAKPIDLSGTKGVTPEQQAEAENIIAETLRGLPQWSDPATAEAAGFRSIGDGFTGIEHFVNAGFMNDDTILDPDKPESLVFNTEGGGRRLVAAMYMLKTGTPLEDAPKTGGELMQWHTHDNLCYNAEGLVRGITDDKGNCAAGLTKPVETPMIHVWTEKHPCGPFAALEGIGGGRILDTETRLCDHAHGS